MFSTSHVVTISAILAIGVIGGFFVLTPRQDEVPSIFTRSTLTPPAPLVLNHSSPAPPIPLSTTTPVSSKPQTSPASTPKPVPAPVPSPPPTPSGKSDECSNKQPSWIWCDDFETDRFSSYFEKVSSVDTLSRVANIGLNGSMGIKFEYQPGRSENGNLKIAFGRTPSSYFRPIDAGTKDYREIYWRFYLKNQPGWTGGAGDKLTRAIVFANSEWANAAKGHLWGGEDDSSAENYLILDPTSGTDSSGNLKSTMYNDFPNTKYLGIVQGTEQIFAPANVGKWYCIEAHMKLNDAGQSNGVFEYWINDVLNAQKTGFNWIDSYSAYAINSIFLESYWNKGSPVAQEKYMDNFVISTARIGCLK